MPHYTCQGVILAWARNVTKSELFLNVWCGNENPKGGTLYRNILVRMDLSQKNCTLPQIFTESMEVSKLCPFSCSL